MKIPRGLECQEHPCPPQTRKFLFYTASIRNSTFGNPFGNTNTVFAFCSSRNLHFLIPIVRTRLKRLTNHTAHSVQCTALHTVQNESPEPACASMRPERPKLTLRISFETEMLPARTMNCNVLSDYRKTECDCWQGPKPQTGLYYVQLKIPPGLNSEAWKVGHVRETSGVW
jgi:hypothetical protein